MNILLIDEDKYSLDMMTLAVSRADGEADLYPTTDIMQALAISDQKRIDVVFLEIVMCKMNGICLANEIMKKHPKANIIFCTSSREHAMEAWSMNCSGYIPKPIDEEKVKRALSNLRYKVIEEKRVKFRCFGNFEAYCDGKPISFKYSKTKEFLAYIVDRAGAECKMQEISKVLFGSEDHRAYLNQIRRDLIETFDELGIGNALRLSKGYIGINVDEVSCDYFDYLKDKQEPAILEYMAQFEFSKRSQDIFN